MNGQYSRIAPPRIAGNPEAFKTRALASVVGEFGFTRSRPCPRPLSQAIVFCTAPATSGANHKALHFGPVWKLPF